MKITIEVPDAHINAALASPISRAWATEAQWYPETRDGYVVECDGAQRYVLNASNLRAALELMAARYPNGFRYLLSNDYGGTTGNLLLQLMAFGEERYG